MCVLTATLRLLQRSGSILDLNVVDLVIFSGILKEVLTHPSKILLVLCVWLGLTSV